MTEQNSHHNILILGEKFFCFNFRIEKFLLILAEKAGENNVIHVDASLTVAERGTSRVSPSSVALL